MEFIYVVIATIISEELVINTQKVLEKIHSLKSPEYKSANYDSYLIHLKKTIYKWRQSLSELWLLRLKLFNMIHRNEITLKSAVGPQVSKSPREQ